MHIGPVGEWRAGISMQLIKFVSALLLLAAAPAVSVQAQSATIEKPNIDKRWGMLADMAGRSFDYKAYLWNFHWIKPGEVLKVSLWWAGGEFDSSANVLTFDPDSGLLKGTYGNNNRPNGSFKIAEDGSVVLIGKKPQTIVARDPDGSYRWYGNRLKPLESGDPLAKEWQTRLMAALSSEGKMLSPAARSALAQRLAATSQQPRNDGAAVAPRPQVAQVTQGSNAQQPLLVAPPVAQQFVGEEPRIALVIGNSNYGAALGTLANPANDAATMTATLGSVGFNVETVIDADQKTIKRAIARFGERLRAAGRNATGLFFYAGHGIQTRGTNYLIPVGAAIQAEADVDLESVAADAVLLQMEEAGSATNIVILDACRNMPLTRSFRSGARGLARMEAPNGSFVAYSTAPGSVAADGDGANSPFVLALSREIGRRGKPIEVIFRDVRRAVLETTGGKQTPWDSSSLISPFYFAGE